MTRMKESGIDWIKQIPEEWGVSRLKYYFDIYAGGDIDERNTVEEYSESHPYPVLSNSLENEGVLGYTNKYRFKNNCVTVTGRGDVGKAVYRNIKFYPVVRLLVCVPKSQVDCRFVTYWINSAIIEKNQTAVSQLTIQMLGELIFVNVPFLEQKNIADFLDKKTAQLDKVKSLLEEQIQKLKDYRASLIYESVTKGLDKTVPLKDSGIDWIGQVPEGWGVSRLKHYFDIYAGGDIDERNTVEEYSESHPYPVLSNSLENEGVLGYTNIYRFKNNCVTVTGRGDVGKAVYRNINFYPVVRLLVCVPKSQVDCRFVTYWINSAIIEKNQTAVSQLTIQMLGELLFVNVPFLVQKNIADFLDKKTVQIDKLIQIKNQQIDNINKQRQTLIYDYVTGKRRV